jgi:hypothetical protein
MTVPGERKRIASARGISLSVNDLDADFTGDRGCPAVSCSPNFRHLRTGSMLILCYMAIAAPASAYPGIPTPRTSTTGAERSARFVPTAAAGGAAAGR